MDPQKLYDRLLENFGDLHWWPIDVRYHKINKSDPRFEIIIGTVLTQNTNWPNVEKALENLKSEKLLDIKKISETEIEILKKLIKPSGYFNQKAQRLKNLTLYLKNKYNCNLDEFFNKDLKDIRKELLSLNGIGPETADSILLYAGNKPIFVVDAYSKRISRRLKLFTNPDYDEIQAYFHNNLSKKYGPSEITKIYNELHALIVNLAKKYCRKKPDCINCFLRSDCSYAKQLFQ